MFSVSVTSKNSGAGDLLTLTSILSDQRVSSMVSASPVFQLKDGFAEGNLLVSLLLISGWVFLSCKSKTFDLKRNTFTQIDMLETYTG